ncbi:hypothetical protein [Magnetospirillum sp. ME-1]|uniref:hypothetical protein n=1 Tax=Magnetospirillum sp. ME-1 TaxID=1639348 RepID=UPI00143DA515|nr:hypothetical protein [Magnetospirillum sp. ME-1]
MATHIDAGLWLFEHGSMRTLKPRPSRIQQQRSRRNRLVMMAMFAILAIAIAAFKM